jgi:hypothetical protein
MTGPFDHWRRAITSPRVKPEPEPSEGLPPVFQFSQNNLQDYVDCARRFQLRYGLGQQWPAAESEPVEEHEHFVEQGSNFHLLVQRHLLGIPAEQLTPGDPLLRGWWENYLSTPPSNLPAGLRLPETQLSTPIGDQRLLARFDLLAIEPGQRAVIVDWKTTRHKPKRATLAARLQTRVYPFVLAEAGADLFGAPIKPEQISLAYWFAEAPAEPEVFDYNAAAHEDNRAYLSGLIAEIVGRSGDVWPLTEDVRQCQFCVYRSLCDRGVKAGDYREVDFEVDDTGFEIDLDGVEEIAF